MPLQNSIKITDKILITGNFDLLPSAKTIPKGNANTIPILPKRNVKNKPPNLCVLKWSNTNNWLPDRRKKAINEARIASAERYARESRTGKSNRSRNGGKKREGSQVSRKKLQEEERRQRNWWFTS